MAGLTAWLRGRDEEGLRELRSALRHEYSPGDATLRPSLRVTPLVFFAK
jgi:hypothetical protein